MYDGDDRVRQVNEIDALAQSLTSTQVTVADYDNVDAYVEDVVSYWCETADTPEWWDDNDTRLLRERVRQYAN